MLDIAYPDRVTNGYEMTEGRDVDFFDWHYVFGWEEPDTVAFFPKDWKGTCRVHETIRKVYMIR